MQPFSYERPESAAQAVNAASRRVRDGTTPPSSPVQFIAGGTNMTDYMKLGVMQPERLIDINRMQDAGLNKIMVSDQGIRFGALVRMAQAEEHPAIKSQYPIIAESLQLAASGQIRNMASLSGNILQRTRCEYFREITWPCNKRRPGSGCSAMEGFNRQHAILGGSDECIATYHGDFAQSLIALDATVEIVGPKGPRNLPFSELHRQPGKTPEIETVLAPDDLIVAIHVPALPWAKRSHYLKIRDRQSYAFALASAAVALDLDGDTVRDARIALGGVATVPWRSREAEETLKNRTLDEAAAQEAAAAAFADAQPLKHNAFKVELGRRTLIRALFETRDMKV